MAKDLLSDYSSLQNKLEKKFGKPIQTHKDVELLRVYIQHDTGVYLGFNTLRRFFGLLKVTNPNGKTLDVIAQYLGHNNHAAFEKSRSNDEDWKAWRDVIKMETLTRIDSSDILRLLELKENHDDYYLFISAVLKSAIHQRNYLKLDDLLNVDALFDLEYQLILRISVSVSYQFRVLSEKEYMQLGFIARNKMFRWHFVYLFVDYSYLDGYYGFLLEECEKYETKTDDKLFIKLMSNYRKYLLGYEYEEVIADTLSRYMHPTLLGRYQGFLLLTSSEAGIDEVFKRTIRAAKRSTSSMNFFLEIIPKLILIKRLDYIQKIINDFYEKIFDATEWQHSTEETLYLLGKSLVDISESRYKDAQASLSLVVLGRVTESHQDFYNLLFLLSQYHFEKLTHRPDDLRLKDIKEEYDEIVSRTGLVPFGGRFLQDYFL
jgi:hypothetical protein